MNSAHKVALINYFYEKHSFFLYKNEE